MVIRCAFRGALSCAVVTVAAIALTGCTTKTVAIQTPTPIVLPLPAVAPSAWAARGTVVSDGPIEVEPDIAKSMSAGRHAIYRSVSGITGGATEVSGAFFIPKGDPPPGGWQVISFAHGATGLNRDCAPSNQPDLRGFGPSVASLLSGGVAVAFTDYEGLGGPGLHPFLEPRTAGFNVIDAVRTLRVLFPQASTRWVAFGISQGGQASWAADELNKFYGNGLDLLGAVAMAPAANVSGVADLAYQKALTSEQLGIMPSIVVGAQRSYPVGAIDQLLHGNSDERRDALIGCAPDAQRLRQTLVNSDGVKPATETAASSLTDSLRKMALPIQPISAPMLVVNGSKDNLILPQWVSASVTRACEMGGQIAHRELSGVGHSFSPDGQTMTWVADRFAGKPAPSDCEEQGVK
jgi:hypothetical protein